ncbi:MAG: trigger factor [Ruminococcaceae bacterium]|nr:trigger factor [Oscillospiraceae bacterium]
MNLKNVQEIEKNKIELTVVIDRAAFEAAVAGVFKKNVKKITVPGFRKGKATRGIIEKFYGKGVFYEDALNELLPDAINAAVAESGYTPVETPAVTDADFEAEEGIVVKAVFTRRPDVKLGEYKGYEVTKYTVKTTDADVEAELENVQKRYARTINVEDRAVQDGDIADINYEGFVDGTAFEGGKSEGHKLKIGSGQFIPGFEEQIIGHKAGEEFDITVKFPEDYHAEELAGKETVFKIKLNAIEMEELPLLDDEFAKDASDFDTIAEYKADIKAKIEKRNADEADMRVGEDLAEKLCGAIEADIPDVMYERETDLLVREHDMNLRQQGLSLEMLMQYTGMKMEDIRARYALMAVANVKKQLALSEIVKAEKIEADDAAVEARFEELAVQFGMKVEDVKARIDIEDIKSEVETLKAFEVVKNSAKVTEKSVTREELEAILNPQAPAEEKEEKPKKKTTTRKTTTKKADTEKKAATDAEKEAEAPKKKTTRKSTKKADAE